MLEISMGIMNGDKRSGPRSSRTLCCSAVVCNPPIPEPMKTPHSLRSILFRSSPESRNACQAAWTPYCEKRSVRRISFGDGNAGVGSKFLTSAAILVSYWDGSKQVILSTPHLEEIRLVQKEFRSLPSGDTTPIPVMTTLRSEELPGIKSNGAA